MIGLKQTLIGFAECDLSHYTYDDLEEEYNDFIQSEFQTYDEYLENKFNEN